MRIKVLAKIDNNTLVCNGDIEIHWIKGPQAYITWRIYCDDNLIASKSENYYYKGGLHAEEILLNEVLKKIENFRIGRKKIFEAVGIYPDSANL